MLEILLAILVLVLIFGIAWWVIGVIPLPAPFAQIAQGIVAIVFLIIVVSMFFGGLQVPIFRR